MLLAFGRRELVAALRARCVGCMDHRLALWALFGRRLAVAAAARLDAKIVHGAVAHDVAAEVQDEAIVLVRAEPKAPAHHLVIEPW